MGHHLSIDEVNSSMDKLYTVVTNKAAKARKDLLSLLLQALNQKLSLSICKKIDLKKRNQVTEIALDMANSMKLIAKKSFLKAI